MLAPGLVALGVVELLLGAWLFVSWTAAGLVWPLAAAALAALAFGWRALLVLITFRLVGAPWPGLRLWLEETAAFALAYVAMTFEPLFRALDASALQRVRTQAGSGGGAAATLPFVVFVHGWCCNGAVWRPLRRAWSRAGGVAPLLVTLGPVLGDIERMVGHLERSIAAARPGARPIYLVTHSMGGLVARRWLQRHGGGHPVAGVLTIGTPHAGSRIACWGAGLAARQLRPGSDWLQRLDAGAAPSSGTRRVCVWSLDDNLVAPPASASWCGALAVVLSGVGHFGLLRAPQTLQALRQLVAPPERGP